MEAVTRLDGRDYGGPGTSVKPGSLVLMFSRRGLVPTIRVLDGLPRCLQKTRSQAGWRYERSFE